MPSIRHGQPTFRKVNGNPAAEGGTIAGDSGGGLPGALGRLDIFQLLEGAEKHIQRTRALEPEHCVYFVRGTKGRGPIKIGYTARRVSLRLREFTPAYPYPLEVVLSIAGDPGLERIYHRRFRHLRLQGEWFEAAPELVEFIEQRRGQK